MNKKVLSLILTIAMVFSLFPAVGLAADGVTHVCDSADGVYCIVCDVAEKINSLPDADEITVDNAASVTDQIHAIDRLKGDLEEQEYYELLTKVESGNDGSGYGEDVPVRYMNAVEAVRECGGNSLAISKRFVSADGTPVIVDDAHVVFSVTNVETNESQTLTMSTMKNVPGALSTYDDFYNINEDNNGWTYKYIMPAGTYRIEEVSCYTTTQSGVEPVITEVTYDSTDGVVTLAAGVTDDVNFTATNTISPNYAVEAIDDKGTAVSGVSMSIEGVTEPGFSYKWTTDGSATSLSLVNGREYTLIVNSVPDGYEMPEPYSVAFVAGNTSKFTAPFVAEQSGYSYTLNVTIPALEGADVTVEFVNRDGNSIIVSGDYTYGTTDEDEDGSIDFTYMGSFENCSSLELENLKDGYYVIAILTTGEKGYCTGGYIQFEVRDGKLVYEAYDEETGTSSPESNSHFIKEVDTENNRFTVEVGSLMHAFYVGAEDLGDPLPYEVKNSDGNVVAWSYNDDSVENPGSGSVHLEPGTYTLHALADENYVNLVEFPTESEYVQFTIDEDYKIVVADASSYKTHIEDYGDSFWLTWYLPLSEEMVITATIDTEDGTNIPAGTTIKLYQETAYNEETGEAEYGEIKSVSVPTDVNEYTCTWTVPTYTTNESEGTTVLNSYMVEGFDSEGNVIYFDEVTINQWVATLGAGGETAYFSTAADAGYYAETSESDNKIGVIALNAWFSDVENSYANILQYGMYIYKGGVLEMIDTADASTDIDQLYKDNGAYHAIINNIAEAEFGVTFSGLPYVILDLDGDDNTDKDRSILTGDVISASVDEYYKWLGAENPYNE